MYNWTKIEETKAPREREKENSKNVKKSAKIFITDINLYMYLPVQKIK